MPRPPRRRTTQARQSAEAAGRRAERIAGWWLRLKGWRILDRRVRTPAGGVDIIARRGALIAFVTACITPRGVINLRHGVEDEIKFT